MVKAKLLKAEFVESYFDDIIRYWRRQAGEGEPFARYYIDAFQSARVSLLGALLPPEES